jgi:hypothetical protein
MAVARILLETIPVFEISAGGYDGGTQNKAKAKT